MSDRTWRLDDGAMNHLNDDGQHLNTPPFCSIKEPPSNHSWPDGYWESVHGSLEDDSFQIPADLN